MRIVVSSIFVDDQDKDLDFYTSKLGFVKKTEVPLGEHRWLTVVATDNRAGTELLLEPDSHAAVGRLKQARSKSGIRYTWFAMSDIKAEYGRLQAGGVLFAQPPVAMGPVTTAVLDDTCGNLIQLAQRM